MLTTKQEKYVQELIKGKSQREAYKVAYPKSENWKEATIDTNACNLLKNNKVLTRYNELRDKTANKAIWTRERSINTLVNIMQKCEGVMSTTKTDNATGEEIEIVDSKAASVAINAIKELNNMNGYNVENINMKIDKVVIGDDL